MIRDRAMTLLEAALAYAKRGVSVIPLRPMGKKPLIEWERVKKERASEKEIKEWWRKWPDANIGSVTSEISGLIVVDEDGDEAAEKLQEIAGDMETVPRVRTGKGYHLYFRHPGGSVPNRTRFITSVDFHGDVGYAVVSHSNHLSGKPNEWEVALTRPLPNIPPELLKLISTLSQNETSYLERFVQSGRSQVFQRANGMTPSILWPASSAAQTCRRTWPRN